MQPHTDKQKPASMLKVERSPSHSWWWDSHNSPKHSKWLQANLQDLDDKVKEMLRLIEEDADSFAQRAEMYYQKRPELVNLVEEFYRAYRSLAERYDRLTGEIRQNIPRALQVQYGLSCDSPSSVGANGGRHHHYSPLRRSNQLFENLLKKACQIDEGLAKEAIQTGDDALALHDKSASGEAIEQLGCDDAYVESHPSSSDEGLSSSSSDSEVDNITPLNRLRREIDELKEMNRALVESQEKTLQLNSALESKLQDFEENFRANKEEANGLKSKVLELNAELAHLSAVSWKQHDECRGGNEVEREPQEASAASLEEEFDFPAGEDPCSSDGRSKSTTMDSPELEDSSLSTESVQGPTGELLDHLQDQVAVLIEENRKQKLLVLETGEEKREAIRQLCFSMDVLKSENQRLEKMLGQLKKRQCVPNVGGAVCGSPQSPLAAWMQLFAVGFKARPPFVAVAL